MKKFFIASFTILILLFGCLVIAAGKTKIQQSYTTAPLATKKQLNTTANDSDCGPGTHIQVINRSDYLVYVRIPANSDAYDFPLYPAYTGKNIDYISSEDFNPRLYIIVLADDDYTVLYHGYVPNCRPPLYVDNPYYADNDLKASRGKGKPATPKHLRFSISK